MVNKTSTSEYLWGNRAGFESKKEDGEGRFMIENRGGHTTNDMTSNSNNKVQIYLRKINLNN